LRLNQSYNCALKKLGMNGQAYLDRINYRGPTDPSARTLRQLQRAHLLAVPFENLSIHAGEPIVLNDEALFQKIVERRRGGFCYELNGLFAALLRELGFKVAMLSAQVAGADGDFSEDFDHMTLMVTLSERWLADVGFGDSFVEPLPMDERKVQIRGNRAYRLDSFGEYLVLSQRLSAEDGEWKQQYRFRLKTYQYADYIERCHYQQTSPESHFTQKRICSLLTPNGRVSLSDMRFIVSEDGVRRERLIVSQEDYAELLRENFGIVM
jgi:N-hydroxyarylamine O-acetyltransferase